MNNSSHIISGLVRNARRYHRAAIRAKLAETFGSEKERLICLARAASYLDSARIVKRSIKSEA